MSSDIEVRQLRFRRGGDGARVHGFYSNSLTAAESARADAFVAHFRDAYAFDDAADELLLRMLAQAVAFAERAPVDESERSTNIVAARFRLVADLCDRLALSRRERRKGASEEEARHANIALILDALKKRPEDSA